MTPSHKTLVVIPTYNEAENINRLLYAITNEIDGVDILVVDDSSPDGTADIVKLFAQRNQRVSLLSRPKKDGLAGAYLAGFQWGLDRGYESLIEMDADFSHSPEDLKRLLAELETSDVVVGCRYTQGGGIIGWSWLREGISRGGNIYAQTVLRLPYTDLTGGFNGWRRKVLEAIDIPTIRSKGYAFQVELKCRAHRKGFQIKEVPIRFQNREFGKSKMTFKIVGEAAFRVLQMRKARS